MKVGVLVALLVSAGALAGCSAATTNPHLLAPKLVVHAHDDGNVTLYVHGAFREVAYDRIALSVENVTVATRQDAFSLETKVASAGFFIDVTTTLDSETYHLRARLDVDTDDKRLRVVALDERQAWSAADTFVLPYERIIERVSST